MISVVMPAYNAEKFIEPAIQSILDQTYKHLELIVVDDGSTDRTSEIIQKFAAIDDRVKFVKGPHKGVGAAMNLGIENAIYPWIAVMHSDDIAMPERLQRQIERAQLEPDVVIWGSDGYHINSQGEILSRFRVGPTSKQECEQQRKKGMLIQCIHPTVLLNREVLEKVGKYNEKFDIGAEDIELFDRMLEHGYLVTIPEQLLKYRVHSTSLSMTKHHKIAQLTRFIIARQMHRASTNEELQWEDFLDQYTKLPRLQRLNDFRRHMADFYYRRAGMAYGEQQYLKTTVYLVCSAILSPKYPLQRAWTQVLSPQARNKIEQGKRSEEQPQDTSTSIDPNTINNN